MAAEPYGEAFWSKVDPIDMLDPNGCWRWVGGANPQGYGKFRMGKRHMRSHRVSYFFCIGPIPGEMQVLHKCDNPPCVNPRHLFLGTATDNMRDKSHKGRHKNQQKTHCPKGHPYSGNNLYINVCSGSRICRTCHALQVKEYRKNKLGGKK